MIRRERRLEILLGGLLFVTYAWFYQGGFSNQNSRFDLALAMALEHRSTIDSFAHNTIDKVFVGGHFYLEKAPGATYAAMPLPLVASIFWSTSDVLAVPWRGDLLLYAATVSSVSLLTAAAGVLFRRTVLLVNADLDGRLATGIALATFGGTLILPYATMLFGHAAAAAWITFGLYGLLRAAREKGDLDPAARRWLYVGWLALGAAVLTEYPAIVIAAGVAAAAIASAEKPRVIARAAPMFFIPLSGILLHNFACFGSPFAFGYGKLQHTAFTGMSRGIFGIALPSPRAFVQLLLGSYRGLFFYSPVLAMMSACWAFCPRRTRLRMGAPLLASVLALVLVISGYSYWQGGTCFGPRHLVVGIPLLALGAAFIPRAWGRSIPTIVMVAASTFIALLGTVITPFVAEERTSPLGDVYLPLLSSGAVSIHPISFLTPVAETNLRYARADLFPSAAFNLGELIGLRGWWSVVPLAMLWIIAVFGLARLHALRAPDEVA